MDLTCIQWKLEGWEMFPARAGKYEHKLWMGGAWGREKVFSEEQDEIFSLMGSMNRNGDE